MLPIPCANRASRCGTFRLEVSSAKEDRYSKEEIACKIKNYQKKQKDKEVIDSPTPRKFLGVGVFVNRTQLRLEYDVSFKCLKGEIPNCISGFYSYTSSEYR